MGRRRRNRKRRKKVIGSEWAELPEAILEVIVERLNLMDCMAVSDVCKSWRNVVVKELSGWRRPGLQWLLMSGEKDKELRTCISVLHDSELEVNLSQALGRYCWGSYHDWLVLVNDLGCFNLGISLLNPFTRKQIDLPKAWNFYHKIILSGLPNLDNFICMMVHSHSQQLSFWVPGAHSWLHHKVDGVPFVDALFSNGSFYLLSNDYYIWEIKSTDIFSAIRKDDGSAPAIIDIKRQCHEVLMSDEDEENGVLKYLVESCGKLLLVCRFYSTKLGAYLETYDFKVYSLDFSQMSWKRVDSLDDQILFLGKCCSRSVSSSAIGAGVSNCIYFSNDHADPWWNEWDSGHLDGISTRLGVDNSGRRDWGFFSLHNQKHKFCFRGNRDRWGPIWFTVPQWWCCKNLVLD